MLCRPTDAGVILGVVIGWIGHLSEVPVHLRRLARRMLCGGSSVLYPLAYRPPGFFGMHDASLPTPPARSMRQELETAAELKRAIDHAAHYLPSQGPITVFVHHNTLHAFEREPFESAVVHGGSVLNCKPFMSEEQYRSELDAGRIRVSDLEAVLIEDLGDEADRLVALFGTRYGLHLAMLQFPLRSAPDVELRWLMAETDALVQFRSEVASETRREMIEQTRQWVMRDLGNTEQATSSDIDNRLRSLWEGVSKDDLESWQRKEWETFVLKFLWRACQVGVASAELPPPVIRHSMRHRDLLLEAVGCDSDRLVNEVLIRFCASFLDQGFATWVMPNEEDGFLRSFARLYSQRALAQPRWMRGLDRELQRILDSEISPLASIDDSLVRLGVEVGQRDEYIRQSLLALRGWAGMIWQMEFNAPWAPHPAPAGTFIEFLAVRLILERYAVAHLAEEKLGTSDLLQVRIAAEKQLPVNGGPSIDQRAYTIFQLAQVRGWKPEQLIHLSQAQWTCLVGEIEAFSSIQRRRVFHLAYERKYRNATLDAVAEHAQRRRAMDAAKDSKPSPAFQVVCCIDEREESFRRHLEEFDPQCETFGIAGFFGVAMYYKGSGDAHYRPLCPVNVKPKHYVQEEPAYSLAAHSQRQAAQRRTIGRATHQVHVGTRTLLGGALVGMLGSLAAFPLVARILFPRTTSRLRQMFGAIVQPAVTQLRLERIEAEPSNANGGLGYSIAEMVDIVEGGLRAMGLTRQFAELVVICGHGSSSMNNPHEAAHDCGACGGGRGGPNARAIAQMANDPRVRRQLEDRGLHIPSEIVFVGGYHNTCDDSMRWYDLDRIPATHRRLFERVRDSIYVARERNAHERARRFESAELSLSTEAALRHVEGRAEDLSQTRPEYGHATNALCFVGRRHWSRGLFLDRRAFLTSYDPSQDDQRRSILEKLLQAVIPVCAGINLEYYFSYVDPTGYGCGTKLPHNITSLLGVMDGALSDLRTGLPWQMVEIHEPVRLLFVIETNPQAMQRIIDDNPAIKQLVEGNWVQLALLDPQDETLYRFHQGRFQPYHVESTELPTAASSIDWYQGQREHLGYASISVDLHSGCETNSQLPCAGVVA